MSWASVVACAVARVVRGCVMLHGVGLWVDLGALYVRMGRTYLLQLVHICNRAGTQLELISTHTFILAWAWQTQVYQSRCV